MAIVMGKKRVEEVGAWQEVFQRTCSGRVKKAAERANRPTEICLEHARAEMKAYEQYKDEPRIVQRARVFETYLRDRTIFITDGELMVGSATSKIRAAPISGELFTNWLDEELDDPVKDPSIRYLDKHIIHPEERKELREEIIPYFKGKTVQDYIYSTADDEVKEKAFLLTASCKHIPSFSDQLVRQDPGHTLVNYEKVLYKGLKGIREEVEWYKAQLDQPYMHYGVEAKRDFYKACLIVLDAAVAFAKRFADLARDMVAKEDDLERKAELERIAEVCDWVPANPARDWWEALQSVWFTHMLVISEQFNFGFVFGRFDQYMYPFYKKSVIDEKAMTREKALELLEMFFVKTAEFTEILDFETAKVQSGYPIAQLMLLGGQTRDSKDASNEVTILCLEAEEQVGLFQPEIGLRIWEGTPQHVLKKAAEVVRLGRGKPKFHGDRIGIQMIKKSYPELTIEDWRDYAVMGCVELALPHITQPHSFSALFNVAKIVELVINNGKCAICGKQIGPLTGDPSTFESMAAFKQAFREQVFYWMRYLCLGDKTQMEGQAKLMKEPFTSCLLEGPLQKGLDLIDGGAWYTNFGIELGGAADAGDSLGVIDKLIFRDNKITWDNLREALKANWEGREELRQLCINGVPKYGNDDDYADDFIAFVLDTLADAVDWANTQKDLLPSYGGQYTASTIVGNGGVALGPMTWALPNGRKHPNPLADTMSPVQGMDKKGATAVLRSIGKLPLHRLAMGQSLNQRLNPQLVATDRDIDNFVAYLRTFEELGVFHVQLNVITSDLLKKAMKEPEEYRDILVRVASYCSYFVELDEPTQLDIINRTDQQGW